MADKQASKELESSALDSTRLAPQATPLESKDANAPKPRAHKLINSAYDLSLGISIVVAVLLGLGVGILLQKLSGSAWGLGVGIFWGVGAAVLNIYKAFKRTQKDLQALANDPKYSYQKPQNDKPKTTNHKTTSQKKSNSN